MKVANDFFGFYTPLRILRLSKSDQDNLIQANQSRKSIAGNITAEEDVQSSRNLLGITHPLSSISQHEHGLPRSTFDSGRLPDNVLRFLARRWKYPYRRSHRRRQFTHKHGSYHNERFHDRTWFADYRSAQRDTVFIDLFAVPCCPPLDFGLCTQFVSFFQTA